MVEPIYVFGVTDANDYPIDSRWDSLIGQRIIILHDGAGEEWRKRTKHWFDAKFKFIKDRTILKHDGQLYLFAYQGPQRLNDNWEKKEDDCIFVHVMPQNMCIRGSFDVPTAKRKDTLPISLESVLAHMKATNWGDLPF